ncbi:hypothetical protein Cme02nite_38050 [Catellatospora methionotrophica]|uniref:Holin n=1 Tax=Catellatospora methionotrophica TaxID=121620 RepID=A0A8J3L6T1_9ACTN|nr:hypothetical protein [Catellatospora methionotrophica]GIG15473.1 hypothetical protein Cme02nite_38050 [Catellatospora methionotrophica]
MGKYSKAIVAALTAGLLAVQQALPLTDEQRGWVTIVLAVLGAVGVYAVENKPAEPTK